MPMLSRPPANGTAASERVEKGDDAAGSHLIHGGACYTVEIAVDAFHERTDGVST